MAIDLRDLKPANILLCPDPIAPSGERVKLIDFGIAKIQVSSDVLSTNEEAPHTRAGTVLGTPKYMSPEQCQGQSSVDGKADVYSLGVILYELLGGVPPFRSEQTGTLLAMHIFKDPPPLRSVEPAVPEEVAALVHKMLAKPPPDRPTAKEVAQRLEQLEQLQNTPQPPEPRRRGLSPVLTVLAIVAIALGGFAVARWRSSLSSPPSRPLPVGSGTLPAPSGPSPAPPPPPPTFQPPQSPPPSSNAKPEPPLPHLSPHLSPQPPPQPEREQARKLPHPAPVPIGAKARPKSPRPVHPAGGKIEVEIIN